MFFKKTAFWSFMEVIGLDNVKGEILTRKLQHVYVHWIGLLVLAVLLIASVLFLAFRGNRPAPVLNRRGTVILALYVLIGGAGFFNVGVLTHAMMGWPLHYYLLSMLWSLGVAAVPVAWMYFKQHPPHERCQYRADFLALIPVVHSAMTVVYLLIPLTAIE